MLKYFAVAMLALTALTGVQAMADTACTAPSGGVLTVASGSSCFFLLTQTNTSVLNGTQVKVTIDNTGGTTVLDYQYVAGSAPVSNTPLGIDKLAYVGAINGTASGFNSTGGPSCTPGIKCNGTMSSFGLFDRQAQDPAGTGGIGSAIVVTLASLVTTFTENANGDLFAVHMRFDSAPTASCSGFISGPGGTTQTTDLGGCIPNHQVPEPGSMALFGTGLLGIAGLLRRRLLG